MNSVENHFVETEPAKECPLCFHQVSGGTDEYHKHIISCFMIRSPSQSAQSNSNSTLSAIRQIKECITLLSREQRLQLKDAFQRLSRATASLSPQARNESQHTEQSKQNLIDETLLALLYTPAHRSMPDTSAPPLSPMPNLPATHFTSNNLPSFSLGPAPQQYQHRHYSSSNPSTPLQNSSEDEMEDSPYKPFQTHSLPLPSSTYLTEPHHSPFKKARTHSNLEQALGEYSRSYSAGVEHAPSFLGPSASFSFSASSSSEASISDSPDMQQLSNSSSPDHISSSSSSFESFGEVSFVVSPPSDLNDVTNSTFPSSKLPEKKRKLSSSSFFSAELL